MVLIAPPRAVLFSCSNVGLELLNIQPVSGWEYVGPAWA